MQKNDSKREDKFGMKVDFNRRELHLIKLWWLSCEDMMIPEGTCERCEFKDECLVIRRKLYGRNGGNKSKLQANNNGQTDASSIPVEELVPV